MTENTASATMLDPYEFVREFVRTVTSGDVINPKVYTVDYSWMDMSMMFPTDADADDRCVDFYFQNEDNNVVEVTGTIHRIQFWCDATLTLMFRTRPDAEPTATWVIEGEMDENGTFTFEAQQ